MQLVKYVRYGIALNSIKLLGQTDRKKVTMFIMHHGMLGSARNLRPLCLQSKLLNYCDVYLLDARNHGESPHADTHTVSDMADDLNEYIHKQAINYQNVVLLGHSMGGLAVMQLTRKYQDLQSKIKKTIIVDIPCNPTISKTSWSQQGQLQMLQNSSKINLHQPTSHIFRQLQQTALDKDYSNLLKFNLKILPSSSSSPSHRWKVNWKPIIDSYPQMTTYRLKDCRWGGRVYVIYGSQSQYFEEEQIEEFRNQYENMGGFYRIQGAGHWVHFDRKEAFLDALYKILQDKVE